MSADNRICVMHHPYFDQWAVWHGSGSMDYYEPPASAALYMTEEEAWEEAEKLARDIDYLEYGMGPICREEQETGLVDAIADLQERLVRLRETGQQHRNYEL